MRFDEGDEVDRLEERLSRRSWFTRERLIAIALGLPLATIAYVLFFADGFRVLSSRAPVAASAHVGADAEKAEAARVAKLQACGLPTTATLHEEFGIKTECQEAVKAMLKSPSTASFPGLFDGDGALVSPDGCVTMYRSYVDSQNGFGAMIRSDYLCTFDPRTGVATIELLSSR